MWFDDLDFQPHRHASRSLGKIHARAVLRNGATISVVFTPEDPAGPNDEPYEVQSSSLEGENGDGIFYAMEPDDVQRIMDTSEKTPPAGADGARQG